MARAIRLEQALKRARAGAALGASVLLRDDTVPITSCCCATLISST